MSYTPSNPSANSSASTPLNSQIFSSTSIKDSVDILTVEQLNLQIKQLLENQIPTVWLKGEISNFKAHTSGHFYFSLKDVKSQISAVMFRGHNSKVKFKIYDGLEVIVKGRISVFEPRGSYQILCEMMEPVGAGALQKKFEELKIKLKNEGLFDSLKKRPIPHFPQKIVIITSPTGAAIQDMLQIMRRRAPFLQVLLIPTLVQGEAAAPQIRESLKKAYLLKNIDVIILGRGGGSIEDLWAFNDEDLARLIAQSPIPVISAVGHEIDFTICDFVADLRAPTPSAAAELVAKSSKDIHDKLIHQGRMLHLIFEKQLRKYSQKLDSLKFRLIDPKKKLQDLMLKNDDLLSKLQQTMGKKIENLKFKNEIFYRKLKNPSQIIVRYQGQVDYYRKNIALFLKKIIEMKTYKVNSQISLLDSLSPLKVIDRGYAIARKNDQILRSVFDIKNNDQIKLQLKDGQTAFIVSEVKVELKTIKEMKE